MYFAAYAPQLGATDSTRLEAVDMRSCRLVKQQTSLEGISFGSATVGPMVACTRRLARSRTALPSDTLVESNVLTATRRGKANAMPHALGKAQESGAHTSFCVTATRARSYASSLGLETFCGRSPRKPARSSSAHVHFQTCWYIVRPGPGGGICDCSTLMTSLA